LTRPALHDKMELGTQPQERAGYHIRQYGAESVSKMELTFEWDEDKARENLGKHKVSFDEAKTVFLDPFSVTIPDPDHSLDEERFVDIGTSVNGRVLVIVYTERGANIRLISCRKATPFERRKYEEGYF